MKEINEIENHISIDNLNNLFKKYYYENYPDMYSFYHIGENCTKLFPVYSVFKHNNIVFVYFGGVEQVYDEESNLSELYLLFYNFNLNINNESDTIHFMNKNNFKFKNNKLYFNQLTYDLITDNNEKSKYYNYVLNNGKVF